MTNEKRLIDANALREEFPGTGNFAHDLWHYTGIWASIDNAPTVNAVELPCKMGDIVWGIKKYNRGREAMQGVVHQMFFGDDMRLCICVKNVCRGEWGKNVFATKEEAEEELAKMEGGAVDG